LTVDWLSLREDAWRGPARGVHLKARAGGEAMLSGEAVSRRLAAILAADVAGCSRLMEVGEEGRSLVPKACATV